MTGLGPNQLSWLRLHVPKFRDYERAARAAIRDTDASHARHPIVTDTSPRWPLEESQ